MPHTYWLRPRRNQVNYSDTRNVENRRYSRKGFMAGRMVAASNNLRCTGQYLMNNAATQTMNDYPGSRFDNARPSTSQEADQPRAATITVYSNRFVVATDNRTERFCRKTEVTETARNVASIVTCRRLFYCLPIFILLLLGGLWAISDLSYMSDIQRKFESLNMDFFSSFKSKSLVSDENKDKMPILEKTLEFKHIRSDIQQEVSAILEKFPDDVKKEFIRSKFRISELYVRSLVDEALAKLNADKTGMADFALESAGGSVIRLYGTETLKESCVGMFGIPLSCKRKEPKTAIQADVNAGECWPFVGSIGTLVIKLSHKINITGFSMEHIPKSISPFGHIKSAPKNFTVYSLSGPDVYVGHLLGNFTYEDNGRPIQHFFTQVKNAKPTQFVKLHITSNHGNLKYTCLYRFRVHGITQTA